MTRTLGDDLFEGGIKGNYYVVGSYEDTSYKVLNIERDKTSAIGMVVLIMDSYDSKGTSKEIDALKDLKKGINYKQLRHRLFDLRAPEGWEPKKEFSS